MLLLALACEAPEPHHSDPPVSADSDTEASVEDSPEDSPQDTEPAYEALLRLEEVPDQELSGEEVFAPRIHEVDIVLPHGAWFGLLSAPYDYVEGRATLDGEAYGSVGVRLRGKIGSFRPVNDKPKLRVDLNHYVDGQRYYGLESVSLNNSVVDCSNLKEVVAAQVFELLDIPASRASYARVTLNGEDYGLYVLLETQDDAFLRQNWEDSSGNLYDGKYVWYGGWNYILLDFAQETDTLFQLEEGVDVGHADIKAISDALNATWGQSSFYSELGKLVDWPALHRAWAAEQWLGQNDGYVLNRNNYRIYFDPADGLAELIPWDYDYSFLRDYQWGLSWASPTGRLAYACRMHGTCKGDWRSAVDTVLDELDAVDWSEQVATWSELIEEPRGEDPRSGCSPELIQLGENHIKAWVEQRSDQMRGFWGP